MRVDENAAEAEKKASEAFYPDLVDEDGLHPLNPVQEPDDKQREAEQWHTFKTP